jgi:hypothetical protein
MPNWQKRSLTPDDVKRGCVGRENLATKTEDAVKTQATGDFISGAIGGIAGIASVVIGGPAAEVIGGAAKSAIGDPTGFGGLY